MFELGWFRRDGATYHPLPLAQSMWSTRQLHGVAVSGLLARTLEEAVHGLGRAEMVPARYHVDLFRPARMEPTTATATVVREGRRLILVDAVVEQGETRVARATATFLLPTENAPGEVWSAADRPVPPPLEVAPVTDEPHVPFFTSEKPWSDNFGEHHNSGRHQTWHVAVPVVLDEPVTPFQAAASIADNTSMVTNWGSEGIQYINTDIDLVLARRPAGIALGLRALDHLATDGIAVGTAEVYDRQGPLGTATVTCLANARRSLDFTEFPYGRRVDPTAA
jgi:hypothetical protein